MFLGTPPIYVILFPANTPSRLVQTTFLRSHDILPYESWYLRPTGHVSRLQTAAAMDVLPANQTVAKGMRGVAKSVAVGREAIAIPNRTCVPPKT